MSYARQLLYSIADQLGRQRKDMDPYIQSLQKNWYDTKEALRSMSVKDFDRLDFPTRLSGMIMEKLGSKKVQQQQYKSQKMQIQENIKDLVAGMQRVLSKSDFDEAVRLLTKIFENIRNNVTEQKYRLLKSSNEKISKLTSISDAQRILMFGGFDRTKQGYFMQRINLSLLDQCINELFRYGQKITFNPYEQKIISLGKSNYKDMGETSVVYNEMLAEQKKRREEMMSKQIKDRDIKVFQIKPENFQKMEIEFNEKEELNEDEKLYNESIKEKLKKYGQEEQFTNKRKQQYFDLLKQPLYTETVVRVKMPENWVWQCKFAPMETLQSLVDIFHQNLDANVDYYLYMTPPVQILKGALLRSTFYDLGCVPRAVFIFKTEAVVKDNIMKTKKGGFFSFFK